MANLIFTLLIIVFSPIIFYSFSKTKRVGVNRAIWCLFAIATFLSVAPEISSSTLDFFWSSLGGGAKELGYSLPFALTSIDGKALQFIASHAKPNVSPYFSLIKYILVALIAGGVTSVAMWLVSAMAIGYKENLKFPDALAFLKVSSLRGSLVVISIGWILFTVVTFLVRDWHVLGTTFTGEDFLFIAVDFSAVSFGIGLVVSGIFSLLFLFVRQEKLIHIGVLLASLSTLIVGLIAIFVTDVCPFIGELTLSFATWQKGFLVLLTLIESWVWFRLNKGK